MAEQSIEITLQDPSEVSESVDCRLEINSEDNQGKTSFYDSDCVAIRFFSSSAKSYNVNATEGVAYKGASNIGFTQTEYVTFTNSNEASLSYLPTVVLSSQWAGKSLGNVTFIGKTAKIPNKGTGILKVTYQSSYDLIQHSIGRIFQPVKAMVFVEQGSGQASVEIDYSPRQAVQINSQPLHAPPDENKTAVPYTLVVLDYSSLNPLSGAEVYLNGCYIGVTDDVGKIFLGNLTPGNYSLYLRRDGYFPSGEDGLNNDGFTVH